MDLEIGILESRIRVAEAYLSCNKAELTCCNSSEDFITLIEARAMVNERLENMKESLLLLRKKRVS